MIGPRIPGAIARHREFQELAITHLDCDAFYAVIENATAQSCATRVTVMPLGGGEAPAEEVELLIRRRDPAWVDQARRRAAQIINRIKAGEEAVPGRCRRNSRRGRRPFRHNVQ